MIIKPSSALRKSYSAISNQARDTQEPIFITVNGDVDSVFMSLEAFERQEQILQLRPCILEAEEERLRGTQTMTLSEAREALEKRDYESDLIIPPRYGS